MFYGDPLAASTAKDIVKKLTDYRGNKTHDRHIDLDECAAIGLKIVRLELDNVLQDLVLSVHHCFMAVFGSSGAVKIIENDAGIAWVKVQQP